ncbi:unnamed protein product [Bursaphelenchus okinawaensis]|uniref:Cytochrome c oxidase assembly factor 6 homolog n=1 Tax=Bursaphelenchus okinawaensis TaxID=465554 RepID=A0A811K1X8_9BILA|nr:unnamed protein product [Bursaphelenchus okinawaensis]CAG9088662.1 unnamed protein product [Bursaphelenchus okinawaensis]
MSSEVPETSLKTNRKECYRARDEYLNCMDENEGDEKKCRALMVQFKSKCPASWVPHFIRKHEFGKYKNKLVEEGVLSADEKYMGTKKV